MKFYILMMVCLAAMFRAQNFPEKTTVQYKEIRGTKPAQLALDIYNPSAKADKPVIIFVHGGAWFLGDKATKIRHKAALFKSLDYVFVSVNYRLSSFFNTTLQYPEHPNDVADAVAWVFKNIKNYGGSPEKIILMGHSAGAQIVSLLGTSPEFLPARSIALNRLRGVASIDTEGYDVLGMGESGVKIYQKIFGDNPEIWKKASPIYNLKSGENYPPFLVMTRGEPYRREASEKFAVALKAAGASVELYAAEGYSHFEINNKIGTTRGQDITGKLVGFFAKCLNATAGNP